MSDRCRILILVVAVLTNVSIAVAQQPNPDSPRYKAVVALSVIVSFFLALLFVQPPSDSEKQHSYWYCQYGRQFTRSRTRFGALKWSAFRHPCLLINQRLSVQLTIGTARQSRLRKAE